MLLSKIHKLVLLTAGLCSVIACSPTPRYQGENTAPLLQQHPQWQYTQHNAEIATYITDLVNVVGLDSLIEQGLANNASFKQVYVALKLTYAERQIAASSQWFDIDANLNAQQTKNEDRLYGSSLEISWEADIWQSIANNVAAQDMNIASSEADYQAAKDTLVASIIRSYLDIILRKNLLEIELHRLLVLENNEQSIIERYQYGLGDLEALDTARSNTASTRATVAEYREQIAQSTRTLRLLVGVDEIEIPEIQASSLNIIQPLSSLPEQDLARRPDLQSAFYQIQSKRYLVDVSYKALLPTISLSATLSEIAQSPRQALLSNPAWTLLASLSAPLFQGGELRAEVDIAKLNAEHAFWEYQETLLTAVNEVENALGQEQSLVQQQTQIEVALSNAERSFKNYQSKYQQGLVDILDLLTVQQTLYDLQAQLAQIHYTLSTNRIDLGLALGLGAQS